MSSGGAAGATGAAAASSSLFGPSAGPSSSSSMTAGTSTAASTNYATNRDFMSTQPQTIQITAIPTGNTGNSLIRINGMPLLAGGAGLNQWQPALMGLNGGLLGDPFGRQLFMVGNNQQAERRQIDWSVWIWPMLAAVALPLVLAALFVPLFLKTVIILIQILQSLGLLLPLATAISQQLAQASTVAGQLDQQQSQQVVATQQNQQIQKLSSGKLTN